MPEKLIARDRIKDEGISDVLYYLEGWAVKMGKDRSSRFEIDIWSHALTPSIVRQLIMYISSLEEDRDLLRKSDEHVRRLERGCYGKCPYSDRRNG